MRLYIKVNNISRKKLLGDIDTIYDFLTETMPAGTPRVGKKIPFLKQLASQSRLSTEKSKNLEGTYMSYSCSSSVRTLKAEPFYLTQHPSNFLRDSHTCYWYRSPGHLQF